MTILSASRKLPRGPRPYRVTMMRVVLASLLVPTMAAMVTQEPAKYRPGSEMQRRLGYLERGNSRSMAAEMVPKLPGYSDTYM
jgi:hypothetical protein